MSVLPPWKATRRCVVTAMQKPSAHAPKPPLANGAGDESSPTASAACSIATHALAAAGAMLTSSPPPSLGPLDTWLDESCSPLSRLSSAPRYTCSPVVRCGSPGYLTTASSADLTVPSSADVTAASSADLTAVD